MLAASVSTWVITGDKYGGSSEILNKAVQEGIKFGPTAAKTLGINTDTKSASGGDSTEGAIGLAAVDRLRGRGLSDTAIKQFAQEQGIKYGPEALKSLDADAKLCLQSTSCCSSSSICTCTFTSRSGYLCCLPGSLPGS